MRTPISRRKPLALLLGAIAAGGAAGTSSLSAYAQDAGSTAGGTNRLEEVVVTAQRREENIQDVSVAITALDSSSLRQQNINGSFDLLGKIPSLTVSNAGNQRNAEVITIRGQGATYLSPVGVVNYFAEVPLIQSGIIANQGGPGTFFDLGSLQVLRGPQGTLFGRNTTGGAVLLGPQKPTDKLSGYVQAQVGNYSSREYEGVLNLPVIDDKLLVRLSFKDVERDGFTKDVGPGPYGFSDICSPTEQAVCGQFSPESRSAGFAGKDYDDKDYWHFRLGVLWRPTDTIENYLVAYRSKSDDNGTGFVFSGAGVGPNVANLVGNLAYDAIVMGSNPFDPAVTRQVLAAQQALGERKTAMNIDQYTRIDTEAYINTLSIQLNDNLQFRNIASYQTMIVDYNWDLDGSILPILSQSTPYVGDDDTTNPYGAPGDDGYVSDSSQLTFEAQLLGSALNDRMEYTIGGYYSKVEPEGLQGTASFNGAALNPGTLYEQEITSLAFYGQTTLDLGLLSSSLDRFKLTLGVRHTEDDIEGSRYTRNFYSDRVYSSPTEFVHASRSAELNSKEWTWTVGLDYQLSDDVLLYGKATRGYKAGAFNYAAARTLTSDPEFVTSYEVGAKTDFMLGSMPSRLNINAYYLDYDDLQRAAGDNVPIGGFVPDTGDLDGDADTSDFVCVGPNGEDFSSSATCIDQGAITFNADSARIRGIELEATIMPTENLELSLAYSYTDAEYKKYDLLIQPDPLRGGTEVYPCSGPVTVPSMGQDPITADYSCIPFQNTPKHIAALNLRYTKSLGGGLGEMVFFASVNHQAKSYHSATTSEREDPGAWSDGYELINLSLEWNSIMSSRIDARAWVTNATDKTYTISEYVGLSQSTGFTNTVYGEPRMYGLSLRYRFGDQ